MGITQDIITIERKIERLNKICEEEGKKRGGD